MKYFEKDSIERRYWLMCQVEDIIGVPDHNVRYWVKRFNLNIKKNRVGDMIFTKDDIEKLKEIKRLLKEELYTIEGAKKKL